MKGSLSNGGVPDIDGGVTFYALSKRELKIARFFGIVSWSTKINVK